MFKRTGNSNFAFLGEGGIVLGTGGFDTESSWFGGLILEESLVYIPKNKKGVVGAIGLYQLFSSNSVVYPNGIGVKANIGFKY